MNKQTEEALRMMIKAIEGAKSGTISPDEYWELLENTHTQLAKQHYKKMH